MRKRSESSCEDVCNSHSGLYTLVYTIIAGIAGTLILQCYNNFWQVTALRASIQDLKNDITIVKIESQNADASLDRRVSKLESTIYKK